MSFIKLQNNLNEGPAAAFQLTGKQSGTKGQAHVFAELDPDSGPISVEITSATTPYIFNVSAVTAGTEYSQALPNLTKEFLIRCRSNANTQFSFISGDSGTNFIEIPAGASFTMEGVSLTATTIYFQTNVSGVVVEIIAWT